MAPSWTVKFGDRGPARGSSGFTSLFLSSAQLVLSIAQDKDCLSLLSNRWYLDDGVLSGHSQAVTRAVTLIQEMGPSLGLFINVSKCELFGHGDLSFFPPEMKVPNPGAPIGDPIFCAKFLAQKHADAAKLLSQLAEVGAEDPQVAFLRGVGLLLWLLRRESIMPMTQSVLSLDGCAFP